MPNHAFLIHEILSGRRRGFWAGLVRWLLFGLSFPYRVGVAMRNRLYDRKWRAVHCIDCAVISVGNLTTGGTGKTPLVEYIAGYLLTRTPKVAIVSRGYGAEPGQPSDEKLVLCENLPSVPHVAGADRVACAAVARKEHDARVVVMDDGFQHRRLARDLDVVAVDATNPFGFGHFLPRGLLRESPRSLARADVVVITRSGLVRPEELAELEKDVSRLAPDALIAHAVEEVVAIEDAAGHSSAPGSLAAKRVVAFCGLGNPEAFRRTVTRLGVRLEAFLVFGDHQRYTPEHLRAIDSVAGSKNADAILTTQKDRVKLPAGFQWQHPVLVVKIGMRLTKNEAEFKRRLDEVVSLDSLSPSKGRGQL